jgi:hypothetical protein
LPQILSLPILSSDNSTAVRRAATALENVVVVIGCCPIMGEFLTGRDVPKRHEHDLPLNPDIRIARMIAEDHATLSFVRVDRTDEEIVRDLDFRWAKDRCEAAQGRAGEYMPALDAHDLTGTKVLGCKQPSTVD